ncbi:Uncharacterised protein [Serratia marcescens]|uniref:hypothetical protein n=1 Tax=Serratia TaxID=613 RepID=UPI000744F81B|nr:hypothetical protein [Serratia marcescens]CUY43817.1 Uncharacterised protein [Serratia marcescens]CUY97858.1 Uncharacterised protein [Serratia marcescens]CVA63373.1 Uncharacterised protein [Serratia marcescens]CVA70067.1 Uncharacterised protein [Serratia marcescens]CVA72873.1 Uncharacterised protein [Serratia marcescens]
MNTSFSFRTMAIVLLLQALIVSGRLVFYFHSNAVKAGEQVKQLQSDNSLKANIIATQAFQFQRANEISNAATKYGINTDAATQGKEIEYRTILKKQPTCDLAVPAAIAGGLLDYTYSLRSSAMPANPAITDTASARTSAAGELTYCQAVLWIDPLLAAIDKANNQLLAIRQLDEDRKK